MKLKTQHYVGLGIVLIILILALWFIFANRNVVVAKTYTGTSDHWQVTTKLIAEGMTRIDIAPNTAFDYPTPIKVDIQQIDGTIYTEYIRKQPDNTYHLVYPTLKAFDEKVDTLTFNCYLDEDTPETVVLKLTSVEKATSL